MTTDDDREKRLKSIGRSLNEAAKPEGGSHGGAQVIDFSSVHMSNMRLGNNGKVIGRVEHLTVVTGSPKLEVPPPPTSIGADSALRLRIDGLLNEIRENRSKYHGANTRWGAINGELAKAFGLPPRNWKQIYLLDVCRAEEVIAWLEEKRDNTIQGRIKKAASRPGYRHSRGHLFGQEKEYLEKLEWDDATARERRGLVTGKTSRADMSDDELRNWVAYLRREHERLYGD
jgi:hypothetical protein